MARPGQQQGRDLRSWLVGGEAQLQYSDHLGNGVDLFAVAGGSRELVIRCRGEVELLTFDGVIGAHRGPMPLWTFLRPTALTRAGRQVRMLAAGLGRDDFASEIERAHALSALILARLPWRTGVTDAEPTAEQALGGAGESGRAR